LFAGKASASKKCGKMENRQCWFSFAFVVTEFIKINPVILKLRDILLLSAINNLNTFQLRAEVIKTLSRRYCFLETASQSKAGAANKSY
jgi:hypothetical protein